MIRLGRVLLVPAGDQSPAGRQVEADAGRLRLDRGDAAEDCWVPADAAELIETDACGTYLRVGRPARVEHGGLGAVELTPGLYQVIRRRE